MKNVILILLSLILLSSCVTTQDKHFIQKVDGTWMSKREVHRFCKRTDRKIYKNMSKKRLNELFDNTTITISIDTTTTK